MGKNKGEMLHKSIVRASKSTYLGAARQGGPILDTRIILLINPPSNPLE